MHCSLPEGYIAIIMKIPNMAKIVYRQMPAPREQIPDPEGTFLLQILGGVRGLVMDEIDTCIETLRCFLKR